MSASRSITDLSAVEIASIRRGVISTFSYSAGIFKFTARDFFQKTSDEAANVPLADFGTVE